MAVIRPFRAIFPAHATSEDVSRRTAPPYDVIGPALREDLLRRDDHNVVALELPEGPLDPAAPGNRYETGLARWREWLRNGVLVPDESEAIYILEQRFEFEGRDIRRRCLIVSVDLEPFSAGVVIPHERTLPKALDDRLRLTRATAANLSQVFAMYSDPDRITDRFFEEAERQEPLLVAIDDDGVESVVRAIRDRETISGLAEVLADKKIFIADGHHRYATALAYRDEQRARDGEGPWRPYDGIMMALVNMDDPNLIVLAAHRVANADGFFSPSAFRAGLTEHFTLTDVDPQDPERELLASDRPAFVVKTVADGVEVLARLRDHVDPAHTIPGEQSGVWKGLDVSVLQELVLRPLLGIDPDRPDSLDRLDFVRDAREALSVDDRDVVFVMRPTRLEQLRAVTLNGEIMPQKSTYFYPKILSGLLMRSLEEGTA